MKSLYTFLLIISLTSSAFGQELIVRSSLENMQYVEDVDWVGDDIYCAGYTFKTKLNDGNSSDAYLTNYDSALKPKWSLKISDEPSNKINSILRHNDKIYALVTLGKVDGKGQDVSMNLLTISLDGVLEDKISFGRSFYSPSNMVVRGSNLIFGYSSSKGTSYVSENRSEVISYNMETKKFVRFTSSQELATPKKMVADPSNVVLVGNYIHPDQPNIILYKNGKYAELSLKATKTEYFLDSYIQNNVLTIVCVFPGIYGNMNKYLRYYSVNLKTNAITSSTIPYQKMGWEDVNFDTYSTGSSTWITAKNKEKALQYQLLEKGGKITKTLNFDSQYGNGSWENFIIKNGMILNANSDGIKLYKTE